jgi:hypothetical protein
MCRWNQLATLAPKLGSYLPAQNQPPEKPCLRKLGCVPRSNGLAQLAQPRLKLRAALQSFGSV